MAQQSQQSKEVKPLSPSEVHEQFSAQLDPDMIQAVNNLLIKKYSPNNTSISFRKLELLDEYFRITTRTDKQFRSKVEQDLYDRNQLDFENLYRKEGWLVSYNSPDRGESFDPYFEFKQKVKITK